MEKDKQKSEEDNLKPKGLGKFIVILTVVTAIISIVCIVKYRCWNIIHNSDNIEHWGAFGDYIGGVVGTLIAFAVFLATIYIIILQKKELQETREELKKSREAQDSQAKLFAQQQFETTFFNMLDLLHKYSKPEKQADGTTKTWTEQYALILFSLLNNTTQYAKEKNTDNKEKNNIYINLVKANLDTDAFLRIIAKFIGNTNQIYYPYQNLKELIEEYSLFDYIPKYSFRKSPFIEEKSKTVIKNHRRTDEPHIDETKYNNILKHFKLSAFENNCDLLVDRIALEEDSNELAKYAGSPYKEVRLAVAKNEHTAKETLELLSKDSDNAVSKAAKTNENFKAS